MAAAAKLAPGMVPYSTATVDGRPTVYMTDANDDIPIIIDTGASLTVTPVATDFIGAIDPAPIQSLKGLQGDAMVMGKGTVSWTIIDLYGVVRTLKPTAYYVPTASVRLFSPQTHFMDTDSGSLLVNSRRTTLRLSDGSELEFPFNDGNQLPYMLLSHKDDKTVGLVSSDLEALRSFDGISNLLSVAQESNQNLTSSQRELLYWHWKLGHPHFAWVQSLAAQPRDSIGSAPILRTKVQGVSSCPAPLCAACQLAKQRRRGAGPERHVKDFSDLMKLKENNLKPGDRVSIDQYISAVPGRLPHTKGKESKNDKFVGGTLFVDHATGFVFVAHQVSLRAGETVQAKRKFEAAAHSMGVSVTSYRADNVPFGSAAFRESLRPDQKITYSGTGAHHQNGVAERTIQTVTSWARAMLLHAVLHWPEAANLELWPFALQHAVWSWNHLPRRDVRLAPLELFSQSTFPSYDHLQRCHVWGCPTYVLDPALQDGKKVPKWAPRSRRGQFLGFSPEHSSTVALILNHRTGHVSPQYHVVHDDLFTTVPNADAAPVFDTASFDPESWSRLVSAGLERSIDDDDQPQLAPPADAWPDDPISGPPPDPVLAAPPPVPPPLPAPVSAPPASGGGGDLSENPSLPTPTVLDFTQVDPGLGSEGAVPTGSPNVIPETVPRPQPASSTVPPTTEAALRRSRRTRRPNPDVSGPEWVTQAAQSAFYTRRSTQKIRSSVLNDQFLHSLHWNDPKPASHTLRALLSQQNLETDFRSGLPDWASPMLLGAKANSADTPRWDEAMNGPDRDGYWDACVKELHTLETKKDAWEVVDRKDWMKVLPSTWVFRCKRFPDGTVKKLKARFCVRGDQQVEGIDFFETFAPVVSWITVRLLLALSLILGLATRQVDYTAAFLHADIDHDPNWDNMSPEERERSGIYVQMPRGFTQTGKVLKLKKSLYGLRQSPRNFFLHLKSKLEACGFRQSDADACLFISDTVICLVYVDDTLFFATDQSHIDTVLNKLRDIHDMELEEEDDVAGFLGVHIKRNEDDGSIELTQTGLTKRVVEALGVETLPIVQTPAAYGALPADKDGDPPQGTYNYASVVGMLQYLQAHSRPDITFAVSQCARYVHNPRRSHEIALERIGQYLRGTMDRGMIIQPTNQLQLDCFVDADFAGLWGYENKNDPSCVKSRTGFVFKMAGCPVLWTSKLQPDIATSTMEAEYNALSTAMKDLLPLRHLLMAVADGVGINRNSLATFKTTVWEDNNGALTLARLEPGRMTPRSKHYGVKYHWFRSHLKPNAIEIEKIESEAQEADILTKALRTDKFIANRRRLMGW